LNGCGATTGAMANVPAFATARSPLTVCVISPSRMLKPSSSRLWACEGGPPPGGTMASSRAYLPFVSSPVARERSTSPTTASVAPWPGARMIGVVRVVPLLFHGQRPHELGGSLDPAGQLIVLFDALRPDHDPALHRPAGDVELPDMRLPQRI